MNGKKIKHQNNTHQHAKYNIFKIVENIKTYNKNKNIEYLIIT